MPHLARDYERHLGRVVGNGHCVALVRECSGLPPTSHWRRGDPVRGSSCAPGTVVATFDPNGRYGNHTDGRSHTAVLIEELTDGLEVIDQWVGRAVNPRLIRRKGGAGLPVDDADAYYVVELGEDD